MIGQVIIIDLIDNQKLHFFLFIHIGLLVSGGSAYTYTYKTRCSITKNGHNVYAVKFHISWSEEKQTNCSVIAVYNCNESIFNHYAIIFAKIIWLCTTLEIFLMLSIVIVIMIHYWKHMKVDENVNNYVVIVANPKSWWAIIVPVHDRLFINEMF